MKSRITFFVSNLILACFCFASMVQADVLDHWHWRNPAPFSDSLRSVCFGDGKFVAVGDGGVIHVSIDGISWDDGRRVITKTLNRVAYVNGQFLAVGNEGSILTSSNGLEWDQQTSGVSSNLFGIAFGNGKYVVSGSGGQLVISTNGTEWSSASVGTIDLPWITFGNGVFVVPAPAVDSNVQLAVRVSSDGLNWTTAGFPPNGSVFYPSQLFDVEYGNGTFVAAAFIEERPGGGIYNPTYCYYFSGTGTNWNKGANTQILPPTSAHPFLSVMDGLFYEFIVNRLNITENGSANSVVNISMPNDSYDATDMAFGNNRFLLVASSGKTWVSTNGTSWDANYTGFTTSISQIIRPGDEYVAVGHGPQYVSVIGGETYYYQSPIITSADGLVFTTNSDSPSLSYWALGFDGSNYVATVDGGGIYTSTNRINWVQRTSNSDRTLVAICRGDTRWVAVGNKGRLVTSPNTLAWTLRSSGTANNLSGVAFGNGNYVAVGGGGTIITSSDAGATWDVQYSGTLNGLNNVHFLNGKFFAIGGNGTILCSTNTIDWQSLSSGITQSLSDITFADGRYVVCGSGGVLLQSTNGIDWQDISLKLPTSIGFNRIAFLNQSFWLAGDNGVILQSDSTDGKPCLVGTLLPGNAGYQLKIVLNTPKTYRIQVSTNLSALDWQDLICVTNPVSPTWTDSNIIVNPMMLYRIAAP
jgi:hypothetical protein